ncbi:hypothetical protein GUJ93_ZPchr0007g4085 [Zizania palustris]|uniref:Uncharacterized protein n=1 Tax=Zizania palustris TaxID=103762 RepID=A0A8J5SQP8_ZIZPA|nr:hypothetical protein GUJ93_ZPchr0007g4085 [Zizania palustris]
MWATVQDRQSGTSLLTGRKSERFYLRGSFGNGAPGSCPRNAGHNANDSVGLMESQSDQSVAPRITPSPDAEPLLPDSLGSVPPDSVDIATAAPSVPHRYAHQNHRGEYRVGKARRSLVTATGNQGHPHIAFDGSLTWLALGEAFRQNAVCRINLMPTCSLVTPP